MGKWPKPRPWPTDAPDWWTAYDGPTIIQSTADQLNSSALTTNLIFDTTYNDGTPRLPKPYYPAWHLMKGLRIARGHEK